MGHLGTGNLGHPTVLTFRHLFRLNRDRECSFDDMRDSLIDNGIITSLSQEGEIIFYEIKMLHKSKPIQLLIRKLNYDV